MRLYLFDRVLFRKVHNNRQYQFLARPSFELCRGGHLFSISKEVLNLKTIFSLFLFIEYNGGTHLEVNPLGSPRRDQSNNRGDIKKRAIAALDLERDGLGLGMAELE